MAGLFGTIASSVGALIADQGALQTTSENIANINSPGYTRKRAVLLEDAVLVTPDGAVGTGVHLQRIESLRDGVLECRIQEETQEQSFLNGYLDSISQVETLFSDLDTGIGAQVDEFFTAVQTMATDPAATSQRQNVLIAAGNLSSSIRSAARQIKSIQSGIDINMSQSVQAINEVSAQIASLNPSVDAAQTIGGDGGGFEDQQNELIRRLCEQVDVSVVRSDDGVTITTKSGTLLVAGSKAFGLASGMDSGGRCHIYSQGSDITPELAGGRVGGLIRARDQGAGAVLRDLDTLAYNLAVSLNQANRSGFDLDGNPGTNIFSEPALEGAAANLRVVMSDPRKVAASSDGAPGDGANLDLFSTVRDGATVGGETPVDFYASIVSRIGSDIAQAQADSKASDLAMQQLQNQRGAVSGVSLDEEAANLVRFQRAFEASSRVISVVDEMLQTLLAIGK